MRIKSLLVVASAVVFLPACGGQAPRVQRIPDVRGERLDVAEARLRDRGLDYEELGGGTFGIFVRSHWEVCDQHPRPGTHGRKVQLIVDRDCYEDEDWSD